MDKDDIFDIDAIVNMIVDVTDSSPEIFTARKIIMLIFRQFGVKITVAQVKKAIKQLSKTNY